MLAQRARRSASAGIGVPCSTLARVHAISRFCARHTTPQVFISISRTMPPPTLIDRWLFEDCGPAFESRTIHEAAITIAAIAIVRTHGLSRTPLLGSWNG